MCFPFLKAPLLPLFRLFGAKRSSSPVSVLENRDAQTDTPETVSITRFRPRHFRAFCVGFKMTQSEIGQKSVALRLFALSLLLPSSVGLDSLCSLRTTLLLLAMGFLYDWDQGWQPLIREKGDGGWYLWSGVDPALRIIDGGWYGGFFWALHQDDSIGYNRNIG